MITLCRHLSVAAAIALLLPVALSAESRYVRHFAAGLKGNSAIQVAKVLRRHWGQKFTILPTAGSAENLRLMKQGKAELGLVQMDVYAAKKRPKKAKTKVILPLYLERLHILSRRSGDELEALDNLWLSVGHPMSGSHFTSRHILSHFGYEGEDIAAVSNKEVSQHITSVDGADVFFAMSGDIPVGLNPRLNENKQSLHFVALAAGDIHQILRGNRHYRKEVIPAGTYPWQKKDVPTIATYMTLVGSATLDNGHVKSMVLSILRKRARLAQANSLLAEFDPLTSRLLSKEFRSQMHPGAQAALKEYLATTKKGIAFNR